MADPLHACTCGDCLAEGLRFPHDPIQLSLIGGEPARPEGARRSGELAHSFLDAPAAASAGVSDPTPHSRVRTLAAATTGDVR